MLLAAVLAAAGTTACGGNDANQTQGANPRPQEDERRSSPALPPGGPAQPGARPRSPLDLPAGVPDRGTGSPPAGTERVVRAWTAAVRKADFPAAARLFARRARVQNGTPVLVLQDRAAATRWNALLPCGAQVTRTQGAADGFAIVRFRLVDRRGADCGAGTGGEARIAVRVRDGRITDWFRLPEGGRSAPPAESVET